MALPKDTELLDDQIAGHRHGEGKHKFGMLRHKDGSVLKPLVPNDVRAQREHEYYLMLERHRITCRGGPGCSDDILHHLIFLCPSYLGTFKGEVGPEKTITYMKLEDLCKGYENPCIADIKIGKIVTNPEATKEKIAEAKARYPLQEVIGYQLLGMRVLENGEKRVYDNDYGVTLTEETLPKAIKTFVSANPACVPDIIAKLREILNWFENQTRFAFYSSSILFVYDAKELKTVVKMIDFAHVFPITEKDENYLFGLRKLVDTFLDVRDNKI